MYTPADTYSHIPLRFPARSRAGGVCAGLSIGFPLRCGVGGVYRVSRKEQYWNGVTCEGPTGCVRAKYRGRHYGDGRNTDARTSQDAWLRSLQKRDAEMKSRRLSQRTAYTTRTVRGGTRSVQTRSASEHIGAQGGDLGMSISCVSASRARSRPACRRETAVRGRAETRRPLHAREHSPPPGTAGGVGRG